MYTATSSTYYKGHQGLCRHVLDFCDCNCTEESFALCFQNLAAKGKDTSDPEILQERYLVKPQREGCCPRTVGNRVVSCNVQVNPWLGI